MAYDRMKANSRGIEGTRRLAIAKAAAAVILIEGLAAMSAAHLQGCGEPFGSSGIPNEGGAGNVNTGGSGGAAGATSSGGSAGATTTGGNGGAAGFGGTGGTVSTGGQGGAAGTGGTMTGGNGGAAGMAGSGGSAGSGPVACAEATTGDYSGLIQVGNPRNVGNYIFDYLGVNAGGDALMDISCGGMPRYGNHAFPEDVVTTLDVTIDGKKLVVTPHSNGATQTDITISVQNP